MKVELKKINVNLTHSEETVMFKSDLYIDGKKVGYCKNDGRGGCTFYSHYDNQGKQIIEQCEQYFKSLPEKEVKFGETTFNIQPSLEDEIDKIIDDYVNQKEKEKFQKKIQKEMLKGIVYGDDTKYTCVGWKNHTIETLLNHPTGKNVIKEQIRKIKSEGHTIFNTNIPQEILGE